jgi:rSAM/selenodomain-associated transferase 1
MTKTPIKGQVKTRLAKKIGVLNATELYKCFIKDILNILKQTGIPVIIYYTPKQSKNKLISIIGKQYQYVPQKGSNLGERLYNGLEKCKELGYECAVALASDIPDIPVKLLTDTIKRLEDHQAVLGPCPDGGYYLIGLHLDQNDKHFFSNIRWGSPNVYQETIERMKDIDVHVCEPWVDIDTIEDIKRLWNNKTATNTKKYLKNI